jgi:hypothetical protein
MVDLCGSSVLGYEGPAHINRPRQYSSALAIQYKVYVKYSTGGVTYHKVIRCGRPPPTTTTVLIYAHIYLGPITGAYYILYYIGCVWHGYIYNMYTCTKDYSDRRTAGTPADGRRADTPAGAIVPMGIHTYAMAMGERRVRSEPNHIGRDRRSTPLCCNNNYFRRS